MNHLLKIVVGTFALAALPHAAGAADISAKRSAPATYAPAPVMYNWTGFYLGAHVGWAHGKADATDLDVSADDDAFFGGGQIGYNWQAVGSPWVWGLEADVSGVSGDITAFGTGRVRLGYAQAAWMPYVTGGVSWASTDLRVGSRDFGETHVGWTAGAGLEWAFAGNWTAKVEYLFLGLGSKEYAGVDIDLEAHTVKLGANYRF
jgi:outer membrane immunogenic protein